jgi:hypothetical protein
METHKAIRAMLGDRLLSELPRFFGGWPAAIRELFQNAYRAGAQHVTIIQQGNILVFQDDGVGCDDPQLLIAAGVTGWDEYKVVEPAGLGIYSLLDKDVALWVDVESKGWLVRLTPEKVVSKADIPVAEGSVTQGMKLTICMATTQDVQKLVEAGRAFYPFEVTFNGAPMPVTLWHPHIDLDTPVGKVGLRFQLVHRDIRHRRAIWEYRPIGGDAFAIALQEAAEKIPLAQAILDDCSIFWFVDPKCGATPKLPDRNDMLPGNPLSSAAAMILKAASDYFLAEGQRITRGWPAVFREMPEGAPHWMRGHIGDALLREFGWHAVRWTDYSQGEIWHDDDEGWMRDAHSHSCCTRQPVFVGDTALVDAGFLAQSINLAADLYGVPVPFAVPGNGKVERLRITGLRKAAGNQNWGEIWLAEKIQVGSHELPFLFTSRDAVDKWQEATPVLILACDADTAVAAVQRHQVKLPGFAQPAAVDGMITGYMAGDCDTQALYEEWGDGDNGVDWDKIKKYLIEQISDDFVGGRVAKARIRYYDLEALIRELGNIESRVKHKMPHDRKYKPHHTAAMRAIGRFRAAMEAELRQVSKTARLGDPSPRRREDSR